jgi:hypothetical protein
MMFAVFGKVLRAVFLVGTVLAVGVYVATTNDLSGMRLSAGEYSLLVAGLLILGGVAVALGLLEDLGILASRRTTDSNLSQKENEGASRAVHPARSHVARLISRCDRRLKELRGERLSLADCIGQVFRSEFPREVLRQWLRYWGPLLLMLILAILERVYAYVNTPEPSFDVSRLAQGYWMTISLWGVVAAVVLAHQIWCSARIQAWLNGWWALQEQAVVEMALAEMFQGEALAELTVFRGQESIPAPLQSSAVPTEDRREAAPFEEEPRLSKEKEEEFSPEDSSGGLQF